jgi:hypothetical protein
MTLARLFVAALVICSVPAFAQDHQSGSAPVVPDSKTNVGTSAEPWRVGPSNTLKNGAQKDALGRLQSNVDRARKAYEEAELAQFIPSPRIFVITPNGQVADDTTCYTIHSIVVERDERDSDATHTVRSSTCQPASRYRVKSAEARASDGR